MENTLKLASLEPKYFDKVIALGNEVHGDGYLTEEIISNIYQKSCKNGVNCSFVMLDIAQDPNNSQVGIEKLAGFRLTYAPTNWEVDQWCSPDLWKLPFEKLCYFKCSTVDSKYRGFGVAKTMLNASIQAVKKQGAEGGVCHTWMQSPGNVAYLYFTHCGGQHIKTHPDRWLESSYAGYRCIVCLPDIHCHCDAGEMILYFNKAT